MMVPCIQHIKQEIYYDDYCVYIYWCPECGSYIYKNIRFSRGEPDVWIAPTYKPDKKEPQ